MSSSTQGLKNSREQFSWFNSGSRKYEGVVQLVQLRQQKTRGSRKFQRVSSLIFQETQSLYNTNLRAVSFLFAHSEIINPSFIRFVYTIGLMYCTLFVQIYTTQVRMQEGRKVGRQEGRKVGRQEGRKVGRQEGRKGGRQEGRKVGRQEGRKVGRQNGDKNPRI